MNQRAVARCQRLLSSDERQRAERYHFARHRRRFTVCRGGQRWLLGRYLELDPAELRFTYGERGKPAVEPPAGCEPVTFNVSNSQECALCAVARRGELGVDVEGQREVRDLLGLARRFFADSEINHLTRLDPDQQPQAFFAIWTRKEAILKAVGTGLSFPLDRVEVTSDPHQPCRVIHFGAIGTENQAADWWLETLWPAAGYIGAIAARSPARLTRCWSLNTDDAFR